jgi:hypothetical protein
MKSKWIYFFLAFLVPLVLTFILKFFGKSEFNIPVYYENGVEDTSCDIAYSKPYTVADSVLKKLNVPSKAITLITLDSGMEAKKNFQRLKDEFETQEFNFVLLKQDVNIESLISCFLLLKQPWTTTLIDDQNRIRGYYAPHTLEEADRLIAEMKILLKKY